MTANLLDHLQEQGYDPQELEGRGDMFQLVVSGIGSITVEVYDGEVAVYAFDQYRACDWEVALSSSTPDAVIIATLEAAEWQLAAKRGGPVTPAQPSPVRRAGQERR